VAKSVIQDANEGKDEAIAVAAVAGKFNDMLTLLPSPLELETPSYNALLLCLAREGMTSECDEVLGDMVTRSRRERTCRPDAGTFTALLAGAEATGNVAGVMDSFHSMHKQNITPDPQFIVAALRILRKAATSLYTESALASFSIPPPVVGEEPANIHARTRFRRAQRKAAAVLDKDAKASLEESKSELKAAVATLRHALPARSMPLQVWDSLLHIYAITGDHVSAEALVTKDFLAAGVAPDIRFLNGLIKCG
jgi:pentatricopeptide repeat protein